MDPFCQSITKLLTGVPKSSLLKLSNSPTKPFCDGKLIAGITHKNTGCASTLLQVVEARMLHRYYNSVGQLFADYCSPDVLGNNIENELHVSSAIVKYRDFTDSLIKAKIMGLSTPGAVNLMAKYHISVGS